MYPHPVELTFDSPGSIEVVVRGRAVTDDQDVIVERPYSIVVE